MTMSGTLASPRYLCRGSPTAQPGAEPHRRPHDATVATVLGEFLAALHAMPVRQFAGVVATEGEPLSEWLEGTLDNHAVVEADVPPEYHDAVVTFLTSPPPDAGDTLVFSHNDLGIEHVLVDPQTCRVTGIIDWTDAAIVDPAYDLGLILRDLGPGALDHALTAYGAPDSGALRERAVFYARCTVFEDWAFGLETTREPYLDKCRRAMPWLFA